MRIPLNSTSLRDLPLGRLCVLGVLATSLAVADALPEGVVADPDRLQFLLSLAIGAVAIGMALADRLSRTHLVALRNRVLLLVATLTIAVVGAEIATRLVFRGVTTSTDNAGFFTRRWLRTGAVTLNGAGYRERAFTATKPEGVYRIAVVGDSFTFGNGIRQQDRYTDLMQARLPARIEVLNFGKAGDNTPEHEKRVAELLQTVNPDFILLQWYVNDMEDDDMSGRPAPRPLVPPLHDWLNARSALYNVANIKWAETQVRLGWERSYVEFINHRLADPHGQYAQIDNQHLRRLLEHAKRAGVPMGLVLFPNAATPISDSYPFGYLHDRVLGLCAEYELTCVDLRNDFALVKDHRLLWASRFDHHPSAFANEIAAERILATFAAKWASPPK
ncbi:MAG TPA: GDSL-type esterase/lipase family protein [Vicinamibacterales bacterium]|nr:GDSL-type esterase/lipase family protein [Vicinamibacterales bacterium]